MQSADVSLLMSVYIKANHEYFRQSLKSALGQTVKAKEIVLILDGPITTELQEVIIDFKKRQFRSFKSCSFR